MSPPSYSSHVYHGDGYLSCSSQAHQSPRGFKILEPTAWGCGAVPNRTAAGPLDLTLPTNPPPSHAPAAAA